MISSLSCILFVLMFALLKCGRSLRLGAHFGRCKPTPQNVLFATKKVATDSTWESASKGKTLVIVESPAKARTIQKFVDDSYIIDYSAGHIRDLPTKVTQNPTHVPTVVSKMISLTSASLGIDVHDNFKPLYVNSPEKADLIKRLKGQAKVASRILLATDEDREGEAISWHLLETIKPTVPYKRAVFHEITKDAILKAFESPRELDMDLVQSQEARRVIDRLAGFSISPVLWRYVAPGLSAGRVQSCGLHSITERERSRWKFVPSSYCSLSALLETHPSTTSTTTKRALPTLSLITKLQSVNGKRVANEKDFDSSTGELKVSDKAATEKNKEKDKLVVLNEDITQNLMQWLRGHNNTTTAANNVAFMVTDIDTRKLSRKPPVPFITSSLQQEASKKHHFSPQRTMALAQMLYEKGYITYMRTDSPTLSAVAHSVSVNMVNERFGAEYVQKEGAEKGSKSSKAAPINAQEAHEAIRPADHNGQFKMPEQLQNVTPDEKTLYSLILRRTLASVMSPSNSITNTYTITAAVNGTASNMSETSNTKGKKSTKAASSDVSSTSKTVNSKTEHGALSECVVRSSDTQVTFPGFLAAIDMFQPSAYSSGSNSKHKDVTPLLQIGQSLLLSNRTDFSDIALSDSDALALDSALANSIDTEPATSTDNENSPDSADNTDTALVSFPGLSTTRHHTRPPSRFTEASFIAEMEQLGVGRPSTYSTILKTLVERNYIVVDKSSLIPTIQGMVVDNLLYKHFPTFVDAKFTAEMERQLDLVASGEGDRVEMLNKFYLNKRNTTDTAGQTENKGTNATAAATDNTNPTTLDTLGLLPTIEHKLLNNAIDKTTSHTLELPFLKGLGVIHSYSGGAVFETYTTNNSTNNTRNNPANQPQLSGQRYTLPMHLQNDLRDITYDSMRHLINTEKPVGGECIGYFPNNSQEYGNLPIFQKSGKFGKYLQVGDGKNNVKFHSLPKYVEDTVSYQDALVYINLPSVLGVHPTLKKNVKVELKYGQVAVGVEGYSHRATVPDEEMTRMGVTHINNLSLQTALLLLPESAVVSGNNQVLGTYLGDEVTICNGKYGPYLRCGPINCALKSIDPASLTLAQAIALIELKAISGTRRFFKKSTDASKSNKTETAAKEKKLSLQSRRKQ